MSFGTESAVPLDTGDAELKETGIVISKTWNNNYTSMQSVFNRLLVPGAVIPAL